MLRPQVSCCCCLDLLLSFTHLSTYFFNRSFQLTPLPESADDHDYSSGPGSTSPSSLAAGLAAGGAHGIKVEVVPEILIKEEDVGDWPVCGEEEIVCTDPGPPLIKVEPHPDENQASF